MDYVIIGNSAAAIGSVEGIRQIDREGRITLISDEPYHTYSRPLISYWLAGKVTEDKMTYRDKNFYEVNNITPILGVKAEALDLKGKTVKLASGEAVPYDKLMIATGGKPVIPPMEGLDKKGIFSFLKYDDVREIKEAVSGGKKKAVIIGAGLIGTKAAEALVKLGLDLTVVELAGRVLPAILDHRAASIVQGYMENMGIKFELNSTVAKVLGDSEVTGVVLNNGKEISCDMLVIAIGVRPNTDLVTDTGILVNRGIVVNDKIETNVSDVYAAGDVSEGYALIWDSVMVLPLLPNAYLQGETAGRNMAGEETVFPGGLVMNAIGFGDLPMVTAGIVNPDSGEYEVLSNADSENCSYRKVVLRNNCIIGFILLNKIDRAGILTGLMKEKADVSAYKDRLLCSDFGYIDFPEEVRKSKLGRGAA
ncbi:MAG: NAD(P)/FAD-dependent oxidoreductase [Firmicutes bacterium HGW-Firmicutes-14]|nr:MAG: NAD(P)/FAD-dependent oxidoreductase [Firmicutes bacterium HGW-Firmicutes-14]